MSMILSYYFVTSAFHIASLLLSNIITLILLRHQSSVLYINRTILNYLNMALIIVMNISVNNQSISFLLYVGFGPLSSEYAFVSRGLMVSCFFTFNLSFVTINVFRIILILKVCTNWKEKCSHFFFLAINILQP